MRLRLILLTALLVGALAAALHLAALYAIARYMNAPQILPVNFLVSLLVPVTLTTLAARFVYRHTSRRRATQGIITALLAALIVLTISIYAASRFVFTF